jgi:uncharacterized protein (TIGR03435 family)
MIPGLITHLWQTTLFVGAAWLLTLALRKNQAHVRHWVWFAASAKFLLPFSVLVGLGTLAPGHAALPVRPAWVVAVGQLGEPLIIPPAVAVRAVVTAHGAEGSYLAAAALSLWACGFAAIALSWLIRWKRVLALRRMATPTHIPGAVRYAVPVMSAAGLAEPGIFGIVRPVLLLPEGIGERLNEAQLDAILAHELCHVRRRDNLTSAIHMAVQAVFWFHPLVWWLGARLLDERERACDEEVLRLGNQPRVYAEGILNVCKLYVESPLACVSGVTGANLKRRIEQIMTQGVAGRLSSTRKLLLAGAALLAVVGPVITGMLSGPRLSAQPSGTPIVAAPSGPRFEVASIKPAPITNAGPPAHAGIKIDASRVDIGYWSIRQLILRAYGLPAYQVSGPGWTNNLRFNVVAKFPEGATKDQLPEMLQWLLADRFGLVAHAETRELPGFALVVGKGGPKMKLAEPDPNAATEPTSPNRLERAGRTLDRLWSNDPKALGMVSWKTMPGVLHAEFNRMPMEALAQLLADRLGAPVINMTGLEGEYQMTLDLPMPGSSTAASLPGVELPPELEPVSVSLFSTVERLGLKLVQRKTPIEVLVVDNVNRVPTEN